MWSLQEGEEEEVREQVEEAVGRARWWAGPVSPGSVAVGGAVHVAQLTQTEAVSS